MGKGFLILLGLLGGLLFVGCPTDPDDDDVAGDDDTSGASDDDDTTGGDDDDSAGDDDDATGDDDTTGPPPLPEVIVTCMDALDDVYVTPGGLPAFDDAQRGAVVRCAPELVLSAAEVHDRLQDAGVDDVVPFAGANVYRIAYRTTRPEGRDGIGSARVFLPDVQHLQGPLPVVVANHGTVGVADHCAPSLYETISDSLILPFVSQGFAVIAPDYAGLGTDGVQGYGQSADTAWSVLDADRALRSAVTTGSLGDGAIVLGHSQGGGAALSANALSGSYGEGRIIGTIPIAPGWATNTDGLWWTSHYPNLALWDSFTAMVTSLALYADAYNYLGPPLEYDYFDPSIAEEAAGHLETECVIGLSLTMHTLAPTVGAALSEEFIDTVAACLDGSPSCAPPGEGFVERAQQNIVAVDPAAGPILIVQGMLDASATPERTSCLVEKLVTDGVTPQLCVDPDAEHMDIDERMAGFSVEWALALALGEPLPECAVEELPPCD